MPRRKQPTAPVPADAAEAELMIGEYAEIERAKLLEQLATDEAIAKIKEAHSERMRELEGEAKPLFAGLKSWWENTGKEDLAKGKKSAELGAATIGIRKTPHSVKMARKVTAKAVVEWLRSLRWIRAKDFLRVKVELDKEAIIKAVRAEPELAETFKERLSVVQVDEFFIETGLTAEKLKKEAAG